MKSILLVDDHPVVRDGVRRIVEDAGDMEVRGEAGNAAEALQKLRAEEFDLVVLDISLPGRSGLDLLTEIRRFKPHLPVLILSMHEENEIAVRALRSGAAGYVTKDRASSELLKALRLVSTGHKYVSRELTDRLLTEVQTDSDTVPKSRLSGREHEIMLMIAGGKSLKEIASSLTLSRSTVSTYRRRVLSKLDLSRNAELIRYALNRGLLE